MTHDKRNDADEGDKVCKPQNADVGLGNQDFARLGNSPKAMGPEKAENAKDEGNREKMVEEFRRRSQRGIRTLPHGTEGGSAKVYELPREKIKKSGIHPAGENVQNRFAEWTLRQRPNAKRNSPGELQMTSGHPGDDERSKKKKKTVQRKYVEPFGQVGEGCD